MTRVATLEAVITAQTGQFTSGLSAAQGKLGGFKGGLASVAKGLTGFDLSTLGAAAAVGALAAGIKYSIAQAAESEAVMAQTEAVIKSTGSAAGLTAGQVGDMATALSSMSTFSDEAIQKGQNLLLTFTNIGAGVFPQATQAMIDMATAMGTDASSGAIQLGKALNDPIAGISALTRVGVTFSAAQKDMIKNMMAVGDVAGAQQIIIAELNKEFGGSAAAQLDTYAGKMAQAKNNVDDLAESFGNKLLPVLSEAAGAMNLLMTWDTRLDAALVEHEGHVRATAGSYEEYVVEMVRASHAAGQYGEINGRNLRTNRSVTAGLDIMTEAQFRANNALSRSHELVLTQAGAVPKLTDGYILAHQATRALGAALEEELARGLAVAARATSAMLDAGLDGELQDAQNDYRQTIAETTTAIREYHAAMAEGGKAAEAVAGTLDGLIAQQAAAEAQLLATTNQLIYQQLSAGLDDAALLSLATTMGLIDPASAAAAEAAMALRAEFDKGQMTAGQFNQNAADLAATIASLESRHITITIDTIRNEQINQITNRYLGETYGPAGPGGGNATGADFIVPPGYPHDSFPMRVQSGEHVVVTPAGAPRTGSGGGNGTTINLVVNNFVAPVAGATLLQTARAVAGAMG